MAARSAVAPTMENGDPQDAGLSAYEIQRNKTIAENNAKLVELGLESDASALRAQTTAKQQASAAEKKERQKKFPPPEATRASKRVRNAPPQYTGETVDRFGEDMDEKMEKRSRMSASAEEKAAARAEAMEAARKLLEEARAKLRAETKSTLPKGKAAAGWQAEAVRRWGARAADCPTNDWEGFVASREATPAPTSDDMLLQEYYADEPWKLLVACVLMSRVSSHETKTRCIEGFFALCPTPSALLDTEAADVEPVIKSLGLFDSRYPTLVELSSRWLDMPIFDIGQEKGVNKINGAGPFTIDSYFIFCKDDRTVKPTDAALQGYVRWRDAHAK